MKLGKLAVEVIVGAAVVVAAAWLMKGGGRTPKATLGRMAGAPTVAIAEVTNSIIKDAIESLGTCVARESVDITAKTSDKVIAVGFEDGQIVTQGSLLVQLENAAQLAERGQALVNLEEQRREFKRAQTLSEQHALADKDLDERSSMLKRAQAVLDIIDAQLRDRRIIAPISGSLGMRKVSVGDLISPGTLVTTLDDISQIKVDFRIPERHLAVLKIGQTFAAHSAAYPGATFEGTITALAPRVNPETRSVEVRGCIPNPAMKLRPGMLLEVSLELGAHRVLLVPEKAVMSLGEIQYVFVLQTDRTVNRRDVKLGQRVGGQVEVIEGLAAGEKLVVEGVTKLGDKMAVKLVGEELRKTP